MADAEFGSSYEFGPFFLDAARRRLLKGGELVPLTPKAFETLLALVQQYGRTVEKDDLLARVWCGTIVEENNLVQVISRLRRMLGESVDEHRYIVTVPGRGYRFVAEVREVKAERESLYERLTRGALPLYQAVQIALGILATIERLHRAGRIQCRVTPAHILIAGGEVSLREPGTAGAEAVEAYASPEQLLGEPLHPLLASCSRRRKRTAL